MKPTPSTPIRLLTHGTVAALALFIATPRAGAWDYDVHRVISQLALQTLPPDFPAFARTPDAEERVAFLSGEPDRWRNSPDLPLHHKNSPDHFLDIEDLEPYALTPANLSPFRYEFVAVMAQARAARPADFQTPDPKRDTDRTRVLPGFLPWTLAESCARLKSAFSYRRALREGGTPEEIANAEANVICYMGVLSHFAGDAAQPLHTTRHYNGWVGPNPNGFTTNRTFHAWIDAGYLQKTGLDPAPLRTRLRQARIVPTTPTAAEPFRIFHGALAFVYDQHAQVEPLYQLEKSGFLTGDGEAGRRGLPLIQDQLVKAAQFLGDLWLTAWREAPPDVYLKGQLEKRRIATSPVTR